MKTKWGPISKSSKAKTKEIFVNDQFFFQVLCNHNLIVFLVVASHPKGKVSWEALMLR